MSNCPFKKDITVKEWEEMQARIAELEKQNDCPVEHRICRIEEQLDKLEKGKPELDPEQWKPKLTYFNFDSIFEQPQAQWMEEKITRYANQLQWLFQHYPEQNGEWSEDTQWFLYYSKMYEGWCCGVAWKAPNLNLIYMSEEAAKHLASDMNSGKVRF